MRAWVLDRATNKIFQNTKKHPQATFGDPGAVCRVGENDKSFQEQARVRGKLSRLQSFSLSRNKHGTKRQIGNRPMEEAKKMKCYKRLIYKQFVKVSGPCGPQFLSYLPRHFMHHFRALYGDAIFVYCFGTQIWPPEINKNIWRSLFQ